MGSILSRTNVSRRPESSQTAARTITILAAPAHADLLFDTGAGSGVTSREAGSGPGQGITVSTDTLITGMAMQVAMPWGGQIKYMIWNGDNTSLLFSQTQAVAPGQTLGFVQSNPFSFTLLSGATYYFGVIGDDDLRVSYISPPVHVSQNGLSTIDGRNSNYLDFADPYLLGEGGANIALQLSNDGASETPEPSTIALLASGIVLLGLRRLRSR